MAAGKKASTPTSSKSPMNFKTDGIKLAKCGSEQIAETVQSALTSMGVTNVGLNADVVVLNQANVDKAHREGSINMIRETAKAMTTLAKKFAAK